MKRSDSILVWLGATALVVVSCAKGAGDDFGTFGGSVPGGAAGDDGGEGEGGEATDGSGGAPMSGPADEDGGDEGGADGAPGDCCTGNGTPGCQDAAIASCVCAQDAFCCDNVWDDVCAAMVTELGCAACAGDPADGGGAEGGVPPADGGADDGADPGGTSGPPDPPGDDGGGGFGDCCVANNSAGCSDAAVETCVCAVDSYCCDTDWDSICVDLVASESCGDCGGGGGETGEPPAGDTGGGTVEADCCMAHDGPGCADAAIEACVCAVDGFCCSTEWDSICVDQVASQSCGDCGGEDPSAGDSGSGPVPGQCCTATSSPGCAADPAVEACVCAADAFCCNVEWDGICVDQITSEACGTC